MNIFKKLFIWFTLLSVFLVSSCEGFNEISNEFDPLNEMGKGSLIVTINPADLTSDVIAPNVPMEIVKYEIEGRGDGSALFNQSDISTEKVYEKELKAGVWTITLNGKNSDGLIIGTVVKEIEIKNNKKSEIDMEVQATTGSGTLDFSIDWSSANISYPKVDASLKKDSDSNSTDANFIVEGSSATLSKALNSGFYELVLRLSDNTDVKWEDVYSIRILNGQITEYHGKLSNNGFKFSNNMKTPLTLDFKWYKEQSAIDYSFKAKAIIPEYSDIISYQWYVDGSPIDNADLDNVILYSHDYTKGKHNLTLLVKQNDLVSSHTESFEVIDFEAQASYAIDNLAFEFMPVLYEGEEGTFIMGTNYGEENEGPAHEVTLTRSYALSKNEVSIAQFVEFLNDVGVGEDGIYKDKKLIVFDKYQPYIFYRNNEGFYHYTKYNEYDPGDSVWGDFGNKWHEPIVGWVWRSPLSDNEPIGNITWYGAVAFCNWLSTKEGLEPAYINWILDPSKDGFRLPTEAEWEYGAIGGSQTRNYKYSGTNNYENILLRTPPQSLAHLSVPYLKNELGIEDMSGYISEWCNDYYLDNYYTISPKENPFGPKDGEYKVSRGVEAGMYLSWHYEEDFNSTTSTWRSGVKLSNTYSWEGVNQGFRLAVSLGVESETK